MKNGYLLATSAFSNPDLLEKCIKSWPNSIDRFINIDYSDIITLDSIINVTNKYDITTEHWYEQQGCSGSWNNILDYGFTQGYDAVIVVGSDTEMKEGFIEQFISEFEEGSYEFATTSFPIGWNCWCMTNKCYETVGLFDEALWPFYHEDNDMAYRLNLSGLPVGCIGDATKIEHYGSATILKSDKYNWANCQTFPMNEKYYLRKWNGLPGKESFVNPYGDPKYSIKVWQIDYEEMKLRKKIWSE